MELLEKFLCYLITGRSMGEAIVRCESNEVRFHPETERVLLQLSAIVVAELRAKKSSNLKRE